MCTYNFIGGCGNIKFKYSLLISETGFSKGPFTVSVSKNTKRPGESRIVSVAGKGVELRYVWKPI